MCLRRNSTVAQFTMHSCARVSVLKVMWKLAIFLGTVPSQHQEPQCAQPQMKLVSFRAEMQCPLQAISAISQLLIGVPPQKYGGYLEHCSISSDSFGSLPVFNSEGQLVKYEVRHHAFVPATSEYRLTARSAKQSKKELLLGDVKMVRLYRCMLGRQVRCNQLS